VKSVYFLDAKQKETTIWNINNGAAFIPESIVSVEKSIDFEVLLDTEINAGNEYKSTSELSDKIKRFDIILGGFAFMRLGGKSFMNYSENYFSTLSYFNKLIEEQTQNAAKEKGLKFSNKYTGLFSKHESEWSKWQQYIYQNLDAQEIEALADKEGIKVEKKLGLLRIDSINPSSHLYELAILATYGDRKNKSADNLVTDLTNGTIFPEKAEDVSILFGLNNGYSKLRNKYKGQVKDSNVKFTLESKLDYYIIESIYQFVFNSSKLSYSFDYIDKWCPSGKLKDNVKGYETYKILDTVIIAKKKQTPLELFLENYSAEIYSTIVKSINQWLPPFAKNDEKEAIHFFEKQLQNALTTSVEALQKKIESECETNFNSQKQEAVESYKQEIEKLWAEISSLKEENAKLKKEVRSLPVIKQPTEQMHKVDDTAKDIIQEDANPVSVVQEPVNKISVDYESMSMPELKKIAREKKVKGYTKIDIKEDLIKLIKKAPPTLL
jgi:cell division protein FtsB